MAPTVLYESIITCPNCGHQKKEVMPTDACQYFYECENCKVILKPIKGDCCVFCSYGTVKCPPIQLQKSYCCSPDAVSNAFSDCVDQCNPEA